MTYLGPNTQRVLTAAERRERSCYKYGAYVLVIWFLKTLITWGDDDRRRQLDAQFPRSTPVPRVVSTPAANPWWNVLKQRETPEHPPLPPSQKTISIANEPMSQRMEALSAEIEELNRSSVVASLPGPIEKAAATPVATPIFVPSQVPRSAAVTAMPVAGPTPMSARSMTANPTATATPRALPSGPAATAARQRAVALYPALAVKGSPLNVEFVARVTRYQTEKPEVFDLADWPTVIARECLEGM